MKKILLLALCFAVVPVLFANQAKHERADTDADVSQAVRQTTLTIQSGPAQRTVFHGKPPVNPDATRDLLWDQAATAYSNFAACQWDSVMAGGPFEPEFCDNFALAADATIDSVVWWGGYWNGTPAPPLDFWVKIYPDSGGGNGPMQTPIYSERVPYTETLISPADQYYYYEATIPAFAASAGVTYYITFQPTLLYPPQYGLNVSDALWGDGNEGYFKSVYFAFPNWLPATIPFGVAYESSFQLYGTAGGGSTGGPDDFGYTWIDSEAPGGPVFNWIDISGTGTPTNAGDDDEIWPIPFTFTFYGMTFDTIGISSNGAIYFEDLSYWPLSNYALPYGNYTNQFIALYWDDLNPASTNSDDIYWEVIGNQLIIQWNNVVHYGTSDTLMAELILDGGNGNILMQYLDATSEAGSGATVGIQGDTTASPVWYLEFLYNSADLQDNYAILFEAPGVAGPFWDFETGWQGWTQTNGQVFPAAWGVQPSGIHTPCPDPGDSSMWIDSDASGGGYSDSALSPAIVPASGVSMLKYGYYNYGGSGSWINDLYVGIKHYTSGAWTAVQLAYYPNGVTSGPAWDSVDVSAYAGADSIQAWFYHTDLGTWGYYSAFDNVEFVVPPSHDVGCTAVISPPEGSTAPADYDVIGEIWNFGGTDETFDVVANVYDTVGMVNIFTQTINLTLTAGADTNLDFGQVTFGADMHFYTEIYTMLAGDADPSNDTSAIYSTTGLALGDVIFEMDVQGIVSDNQLLGVEFDGERFYFTGAGNATDPNKVYVVDTAGGGTLLWTLDQPAHSTGWGWRDLAWDDVYVGPDRIDTLYASVDPNVDYFSIDLTGGTLQYHGATPGAQSPNRALAYYPDSGWFYTANFSSDCYKFNKAGVILQNVANTYAMYGSAFDGDTADGPNVWWHSQDDPGTGFLCQISRMDPYTMAWVGSPFGFTLPAALTDAVAGGLCFYSGFLGMDVLFAMLQGTPNDYLVGLYVRPTDTTGIAGKPGDAQPLAFGFAPSMATVTKGHMPISYSTTLPTHVSLKVYDNMGRLVRKLVDAHQPAGEKSVYWNNKDVNNRTIANGVYFLKLEANGESAVQKLILVR